MGGDRPTARALRLIQYPRSAYTSGHHGCLNPSHSVPVLSSVSGRTSPPGITRLPRPPRFFIFTIRSMLGVFSKSRFQCSHWLRWWVMFWKVSGEGNCIITAARDSEYPKSFFSSSVLLNIANPHTYPSPTPSPIFYPARPLPPHSPACSPHPPCSPSSPGTGPPTNPS